MLQIVVLLDCYLVILWCVLLQGEKCCQCNCYYQCGGVYIWN